MRATALAMKENCMIQDLENLHKRKESLLSILGNSKGVYPSVNIPSGAASTSYQPVTPSNMDVEITGTTRVWSTSDFSSNIGLYMILDFANLDGDKSSKQIMLNLADIVISSK